MSDGNFNRNLLPYHNFQSGVRTGKAQMRTLALGTFRKVLECRLPDLDDQLREQILKEVREQLLG